MKKQNKKPKKNNIVFEKKEHRYIVDGIEVPSVSAIIKPLTEELYASIPVNVLENSKRRGKGVHQAIEDYWLFGVVSEEYKDYVEAFVGFLEERKLKIYRCEYMVTTGRYAGTVDLILENEYGQLILVDVKTTYKIHHDLLGLQLFAYDYALIHEGILVVGYGVLQLREVKNKKTGKSEVKLKFEGVQTNEGFLDLLDQYEQKNKSNEHN